MRGDPRRLADLVEFARIEVEAADIEPWAEILREVHASGAVSTEEALWLVKGYNAYDGLGSAWGVWSRWPSPAEWAAAPDRDRAAEFPCTQERRGLRGGRVLRHLSDYVGHLAGRPQEMWVRDGIRGLDPEDDWNHLLPYLRGVWGAGRQTAFEWAEFLVKVAGLPVSAPDAALWESTGPRRALQRLYGNDDPDPSWLDEAAAACRSHLAAEGVGLSWVDFETVICDYNVMRDGRYYPGRHLAALREEIDEIPASERGIWDRAWEAVVPPEWADIAPGIVKAKMPVYRDTGEIIRRAA